MSTDSGVNIQIAQLLSKLPESDLIAQANAERAYIRSGQGIYAPQSLRDQLIQINANFTALGEQYGRTAQVIAKATELSTKSQMEAAFRNPPDRGLNLGSTLARPPVDLTPFLDQAERILNTQRYQAEQALAKQTQDIQKIIETNTPQVQIPVVVEPLVAPAQQRAQPLDELPDVKLSTPQKQGISIGIVAFSIGVGLLFFFSRGKKSKK